MTAKAAEGIIDTQFGKILAAKQGTKAVTLESTQNNINKQLLTILSFFLKKKKLCAHGHSSLGGRNTKRVLHIDPTSFHTQ